MHPVVECDLSVLPAACWRTKTGATRMNLCSSGPWSTRRSSWARRRRRSGGWRSERVLCPAANGSAYPGRGNNAAHGDGEDSGETENGEKEGVAEGIGAGGGVLSIDIENGEGIVLLHYPGATHSLSFAGLMKGTDTTIKQGANASSMVY